ncbi:MAG: hypothetical protein AAF725_23145, partial [Acidobacteriota bacterium]
RPAAEAYGEILALAPRLDSARGGRARSLERAALAEALDFHVSRPERLGEAAVLEEAEGVLDRALEVAPQGPEHRARVERLSRALERYSQTVVAELRSDSLTEVTVYRVGQLGAFSSRRLELRPGTYTVVGSRQGFRDVRIEWTLEPGGSPPPLDVRCQEAL